MDKLSWIKELVQAEQKMEESGIVDFNAGFDPESSLQQDTVEFLTQTKSRFLEACAAFNQLKPSSNGRIKIYAVSRTEADFMIFRNGFKLIFSMRAPGHILVSFNHLGTNYIPSADTTPTSQPNTVNQDALIAQWGAFGKLTWTHQEQEIEVNSLVRFYLSRFIKESAR